MGNNILNLEINYGTELDDVLNAYITDKHLGFNFNFFTKNFKYKDKEGYISFSGRFTSEQRKIRDLSIDTENAEILYSINEQIYNLLNTKLKVFHESDNNFRVEIRGIALLQDLFIEDCNSYDYPVDEFKSYYFDLCIGGIQSSEDVKSRHKDIFEKYQSEIYIEGIIKFSSIEVNFDSKDYEQSIIKETAKNIVNNLIDLSDFKDEVLITGPYLREQDNLNYYNVYFFIKTLADYELTLFNNLTETLNNFLREKNLLSSLDKRIILNNPPYIDLNLKMDDSILDYIRIVLYSINFEKFEEEEIFSAKVEIIKCIFNLKQNYNLSDTEKRILNHVLNINSMRSYRKINLIEHFLDE